MIDFEGLNTVVFNTDIMGDGEAHTSLIETVNSFFYVHCGEMWTSMLICSLYNQLEAVAHRYGFDVVSTRDKGVLYIQVVCA